MVASTTGSWPRLPLAPDLPAADSVSSLTRFQSSFSISVDGSVLFATKDWFVPTITQDYLISVFFILLSLSPSER